jgi:hypothetical protein
MGKRLIDANALKNLVMNEIIHYWNSGEGGYYLAEDVIPDIDNAPTVDAVEVVHGWWIELPGMEPDYKCSECGRSYAWWEPSEAHYCPNCGAKMDGDGNE